LGDIVFTPQFQHDFLVVFIGFHGFDIIAAFFQDGPVFFHGEHGACHRAFQKIRNGPYGQKLMQFVRHDDYLHSQS